MASKVKKAKKFRKNHLEAKLKHSKAKKAFSSHNSKRKPASATTAPPEQKKFTINASAPSDILNEPSFDKYLSESESEENIISEHESESDSPEIETGTAQPEVVDAALVRSWNESLEKSPKMMKTVIKAFTNENIQVDTAHTVDLVRSTALGPLVDALRRYVSIGENKLPVQNRRFADLTPALKLYCMELCNLLKNGTHGSIRLVLKATQKTLPYFISMRKVVKLLIKSLVSIVVNPLAADEVKLEAFSLVRDAASTYQSALLEHFITSSYEALVRLFASTNAHTLPSINFAKNVFAQLYTLHPKTGYQTAFQQVRTLALHLRSSLDKIKHPNLATEVICTWQYVHSLDFFSRVISHACERPNSPLRQLIHPLVQVTLRAMTLVPNQAYFPMRFFLARSLIRLSRHSGVYIPLLPSLLDVLGSSALTHRGAKSSLKQFDFGVNLRAPQSYLDTQVYHNGLCEELVDVVVDFYALYCKSIAFPELAGPVILRLKKVSKKSASAQLGRQLQALVERLNANSAYIEKARANVDFGPRDLELVSAFLKDTEWESTPIGSFAVLRRQASEERARLLAQDKEDDEEEMEDQDKEEEQTLAELSELLSGSDANGEAEGSDMSDEEPEEMSEMSE